MKIWNEKSCRRKTRAKIRVDDRPIQVRDHRLRARVIQRLADRGACRRSDQRQAGGDARHAMRCLNEQKSATHDTPHVKQGRRTPTQEHVKQKRFHALLADARAQLAGLLDARPIGQRRKRVKTPEA